MEAAVYLVCLPRTCCCCCCLCININPTTGDLLAALLLARTQQHPDNLAAAVELAVAGLQGVLAVTAAAAGPAVAAAKGGDAE